MPTEAEVIQQLIAGNGLAAAMWWHLGTKIQRLENFHMNGIKKTKVK